MLPPLRQDALPVAADQTPHESATTLTLAPDSGEEGRSDPASRRTILRATQWEAAPLTIDTSAALMVFAILSDERTHEVATWLNAVPKSRELASESAVPLLLGDKVTDSESDSEPPVEIPPREQSPASVKTELRIRIAKWRTTIRPIRCEENGGVPS